MITLLLASHNGEKTLGRVLSAFELLDWPKSELQIIVVNNLSTDSTLEVLRQFQPRLPLLILDCEIRGKNHALNSALPHINGELVVLTDDDILPDPAWLRRLVAAASANPDFDIFGGHILADWPSSPPDWILDTVPIGMTYGITSPDLREGEVPPELIWGGNMMVRASIFRDGARFNVAVGPASGNYIMGSETEFNRRLHESGHRCYFVPDACVRHIIRPHQLEESWLLARAFRSGRSNFLKSSTSSTSTGFRIRGVPAWSLKIIATNYVKAIALSLLRKRKAAFSSRLRAYHYLGYVAEARDSATTKHQATKSMTDV